jgi:DNA-binding transcriptional ArsR family regulator
MADLLDSLCALSDAVKFARHVGEMKRAERARALWHDVYPGLSSDRFGLFGAVTGRAEAQTVRLACLYALLDQSAAVEVQHLRAALAVWGYCEASAKFIFGDALGDPTADQILQALRRSADGMPRTTISELFGRNKSGSEIGRALGVLLEHGLVRSAREETGGRPTEKWYAVEVTGAAGRNVV